MEKETVGYSQIIFAQVLFSFMYLFVRYVESFGVYNLAFARVFLSAVFLFIFSVIYRKYAIQKPVNQRIRLLFFGAIHGFILVAAYLSIYLLSISTAMILQATMPIWIAIFAVFILREKISKRTILAIIISFIGLIFLLYTKDFSLNSNILGILAALFVGVFGGLVYVLSKTFRKYDGYSLTFWQNLIATPFLIPLLFFQKPLIDINNLIFVFLIVVCGAAGFVLLFVGLKKVNAGRAGVVTLLNYLLTIILGIIFLSEIPSVKEITGGVLVLIGILLVLVPSKKNSKFKNINF